MRPAVVKARYGGVYQGDAEVRGNWVHVRGRRRLRNLGGHELNERGDAVPAPDWELGPLVQRSWPSEQVERIDWLDREAAA